VTVVAGFAHHSDDLLDRRRVGGVLLTLVAWRTTSVVARQRRWRTATASRIEQRCNGHGILLPIAVRTEHAAVAALACSRAFAV
jgi:hypothetical protein